MYNGIGLQTARGSGTNGYVQTNKFFVKPKAPRGPPATDSSGGGGGGIRKPNKEILDHDRKRQIEIKLLVLSETLADQGYTETEIAERIEEKRMELDAAAAAAADPEDGEIVATSFANRPSETQSHQVAARKEKQMEALKAAFGLLDKSRGRRQGDEHPEKDDEKASGSKDLKNQLEKVRYTTTKAEVERNEMEHDKKNDERDKIKERKKYERNYESSDSESSGDKTRRGKKHVKAQNEKVKYNTKKSKVDRNEMEHDKKNDGRGEIKERKKYDRDYESSDGGSTGDKMRRDKWHGKSKVDRNEMEHDKKNDGRGEIKEQKKYDRNYESSDGGISGNEMRRDKWRGKSKVDRNEMEHDKKNDGRGKIKEQKKYDRNYQSSDGGSSGDEMRRDKRHEKALHEKVKYDVTKGDPMGREKRNKGRDKLKEQKLYDRRNYESSDSGSSDKMRRERKRHGKTHDLYSDSEAATTVVHKKRRERASRENKKEKRKRYSKSSDSDSESDRVNFKREPIKYAKRSKRHDSDSDY